MPFFHRRTKMMNEMVSCWLLDREPLNYCGAKQKSTLDIIECGAV